MPSPIMTTVPYVSLREMIAAVLSSGFRSARMSSIPRSAATAFAVTPLSPVSMTVATPIVWSSSIMAFALGLTWSRTAMMPMTFSCVPTNITVFPSARNFSVVRCVSASIAVPVKYSGLPANHGVPSMIAVAAWPGRALSPTAPCALMPSVSARFIIAQAIG